MKQSSTTLRSIRIVSGIAILIVITVFLAACSSIPLGTMWKMRGMGLEDLAGTNPEEVRAAVMSESWFLDSPNFDSGRLKIEMRRADNSVEAFSFILADTSERGHYGLEAAGGRWRWRIYQIEATLTTATTTENRFFAYASRKLEDISAWMVDGVGAEARGGRDLRDWMVALAPALLMMFGGALLIAFLLRMGFARRKELEE